MAVRNTKNKTQATNSVPLKLITLNFSGLGGNRRAASGSSLSLQVSSQSVHEHGLESAEAFSEHLYVLPFIGVIVLPLTTTVSPVCNL